MYLVVKYFCFNIAMTISNSLPNLHSVLSLHFKHIGTIVPVTDIVSLDITILSDSRITKKYSVKCIMNWNGKSAMIPSTEC